MLARLKSTLSMKNPLISRPWMVSTLSCLVVSCLQAADWAQWRGEGREGRSPDTDLLQSWPEGGPKRVWLYRDAGVGYSGPSVVGGKLFTMGARDGKVHLICLNASDGAEVWSTEFDEVLENNWGDGPRATPTYADGHVYALSGKGNLLCATAANGAKVWSVSLTEDFGGKLQNWGYTESVLVDGDKVICTPGGSQGAVLALNKKTGEKVWQSSELTVNAQYSSPIVVEHAGKKQYIQFFQKTLAGFDPTNGKVLWKTEYPKGRTAVIPTPVYHNNIVYVTAGYGAGCKAVKLSATNEVTELYAEDAITNHHGGVIRVGDHLYGNSDKGGWTCQKLDSGEIVWSERKALRKGAIGYADGRLYCLEEKSGTVVLAEASTQGWKEHGRFTLEPQTELRKPSGRIWTHPVIVGGRLYLRDQDLIYCYDVAAK